MTSVDNSQSADNSPLADGGLASAHEKLPVEYPTGPEVGLFGKGVPVLPHTCSRSCLTSPDSNSLDGACALVRELASGAAAKDRPRLYVCDKGHTVGVQPGLSPDTALLLLRPNRNVRRDPEPDHFVRQVEAAGAIWKHLDRVEQEVHGLSMELIRSFEQLNVLFDITRQIGARQDVPKIKLFLLRKLTETLCCDWACCISEHGETHWWYAEEHQDHPPAIEHIQTAHADVLETVSAKSKIVVRSGTECPGGGASVSLMFGPLDNNGQKRDVVVLGRGQGRSEFESGDMMMLDSVLSYGGHVISNLSLVQRLKQMSFEAVRALVSAIDKKDTYTCGHSERVGFLSRLIGEKMRLTSAELQDLEWAGLLHDIGKIGIRDNVLQKPGKLTEEEWVLIKQHPRMSFEVIEPLESFAGVREAVLYHHETPDGTGYPEGLKGDAIPLPARILHVADTFDALTSDRSYRRGFSVEKAREIMRRETGGKIDPGAMEAFEEALAEFRAQQPIRFRKMFTKAEESSP